MKLQLQRIGRLASAVVIASALTGSAQAGVGTSLQGVVPDAFERAVARTLDDQPVRPDDRPGMLGVGGITAAAQPVVPDVFERAVLRHGPQQIGLRSESTATEGFQWGTAAFGVGAAFGIVLFGAAGALTLRRRGRVILP